MRSNSVHDSSTDAVEGERLFVLMWLEDMLPTVELVLLSAKYSLELDRS